MTNTGMYVLSAVAAWLAVSATVVEVKGFASALFFKTMPLVCSVAVAAVTYKLV